MSNSDELLQWLRSGDRTHKWGMVAALERKSGNKLLLQEYIRRFNSESYLNPVTISSPSNSGEEQTRLESILLDKPRLSFENADILDSRGRLRMQVVGGNILTSKLTNQSWQVRKLEYFSPVQGPELLLDIKLPDTPISVLDDGKLRIDLKHSSDFLFTHVDEFQDQKRVGDLFKEYFQNLPADQRQYVIGELKQSEVSEYLTPEAFYLRTQGGGTNGAILIFTRLKGDADGTFPGAEYQYLLPNGKTATVLFESSKYMMPAIAKAWGEQTESEWELVLNNENRPRLARATKGHYNLRNIPFIVPFEEGMVNGFNFTFDELSTPWENSATLELVAGGAPDSSDHLLLSWSHEYLSTYTFSSLTNPEAQQQLENAGDLANVLYVPQKVSVRADYYAKFSITPTGELIKFDSSWNNFELEFIPEAPPARTPKQRGAANEHEEFINDIKAQLNELNEKIYRVRDELKEPIAKSLNLAINFHVDINELLLQQFKLIFGQTIIPKESHITRCHTTFGDLAPNQLSFSIYDDIERIVLAGDSTQFKASTEVTWSAEAVGGGTVSGTIDSLTGIYQAPTNFEGNHARVRIIAKAKSDDFFSVAMVTVVKTALSVNPLIQSTQMDVPLKLKAGSALGGDISWSIKQTGTHGSLSSNSGSEVEYTPGKDFGDDPDVIFVVDEIEVTLGNTSETIYIVNRNSDPMNTIKVQEVDANRGTAQLKAIVKNKERDSEWSILVGPGTIDSTTGLYQADNTATERFVLIQSAFDSGVLGILYGFIILPLPLAEAARALPGTVEISPKGTVIREVRALK
jgi:hypothetical protein